MAIDRKKRRKLNAKNKARQRHFVKLPEDQWPIQEDSSHRIEVWINKDFLVQVFDEGDDVKRLTISRTTVNSAGDWEDGITWDELQDIKGLIGYGDSFGVEIYPETIQVVNVANMRHIWLLPERLPFAWRNI